MYSSYNELTGGDNKCMSPIKYSSNVWHKYDGWEQQQVAQIENRQRQENMTHTKAYKEGTHKWVQVAHKEKPHKA